LGAVQGCRCIEIGHDKQTKRWFANRRRIRNIYFGGVTERADKTSIIKEEGRKRGETNYKGIKQYVANIKASCIQANVCSNMCTILFVQIIGARQGEALKAAREQGGGALQKCATSALLAAILSAPVLTESAGPDAVFAKQLHAAMLAYGVDRAVAAVILAAPVLAHAAASAVLALNPSAAVLTNAAAATVLAQALQSPVLANVLSGAASSLVVALVSAAAARVFLVQKGEISEAAEHGGRTDERAYRGIFLQGVIVICTSQTVKSGALRHNVHEMAEKGNVRLFADGLDLSCHCQRRAQGGALMQKTDETQ
jgi:hypothetical protein